MKSPLLAIRRCTIALSLVHLAIFASFFVPYLLDPRENLWQVLLPPWNNLFAFSRAPFIIIASIMFIPLLLPLFASWAAVRSPMKMMSLVGMRMSLPLLFASWFFWGVLALELYSPASGLQGFLRLVLFVPACGFVLAFFLCLVLARYLRRLQVKGITFSTNQSSQDESQASGQGAQTAYAGLDQLLPSSPSFLILTTLGLLCQVFVLLSLFLPYIEAYDPYKGVAFHITGWQTLGLEFPLAMVALLLLVVPLLPLSASLIYKSSLSFKRIQKGALLKGSIYLSYWLNMVCFILSSIILEYSLLFIGADFNKETHWLDAAFGIPVTAFLLALLCSGILRVYALRFTEGGAIETDSATEISGL